MLLAKKKNKNTRNPSEINLMNTDSSATLTGKWEQHKYTIVFHQMLISASTQNKKIHFLEVLQKPDDHNLDFSMSTYRNEMISFTF